MTEALDALRTAAPALAFLLAAVPLAALLGQLGFFDALAAALQRRWPELPVLALWVLAAVTTATLNLDTAIVLLTPLYVRLARRSGVDPLALVVVPLLLAAFASSFLPVSNLTTLITVEHLDLDAVDVLRNLAVPALATTVAGWLVYRRSFPTRLPAPVVAPVEASPSIQTQDDARRALLVGSTVVAVLLASFLAGPSHGVDPWIAVVVVDVVLAIALRSVPWRDLPVATALGVAAAVAAVAVVVPASALDGFRAASGPGPVGATVLAGAAAANVVNNIPATLAVLEGATRATPGTWAWLLGANVGSVLLPFGSLANLLWRRLARAEGIELDRRAYVRTVAPLAVVPLVVAAAVAAITLG